MKTAGTAITILRVMTSLLLIAITSSGVVAGQKEVVLDSRGQPVETNTLYYIRIPPEERAYISAYGKWTFSPFSCTRRVVLFSVETPPPPVVFVLPSTSSFDQVDIRVSTELNIMFRRLPFCSHESYWRVANSSLPIKEVEVSGSESSYETTFTIQKHDFGYYKFAFGSADKPTDIGLERIFPGFWRLILSNSSSFGVSFVPVY